MKKHIPNTITCCNLVSGCIAVTYALMGEPGMALLWIIMGAVFDFFDGMSARLLGVSSPIGKELDSLADDVTFGVAPSAMVYHELCVMEWPAAVTSLCAPALPYLPYLAFVMAAFSALRLAKFNLDERQTTSFIGLPTPANALFWGSLIVGAGRWIESTPWGAVALLVGVCVSSWLLVAELPMFALKFKHWGWKGNEVKYIFIVSCVPLLLFFGITAFAFIIAWYIVLSAVKRPHP
ncbi:MAG: CDP-alcohol phosphatidyltransferase family protein [Prevotella sp.]|jgi:CDP-diacylglycerol--serine O-phosphatidyltransferase|nr:CDP-alcohol phosphatidyltransferase family protein [Prevotella sp.]